MGPMGIFPNGWGKGPLNLWTSALSRLHTSLVQAESDEAQYVCLGLAAGDCTYVANSARNNIVCRCTFFFLYLLVSGLEPLGSLISSPRKHPSDRLHTY